ncbi:hypothetical protein MKX03_011680, partial [Papaver bracteatum]
MSSVGMYEMKEEPLVTLNHSYYETWTSHFILHIYSSHLEVVRSSLIQTQS